MVETAVDLRFDDGPLARALRLRQMAVLQLAQQRDRLRDAGQRVLGVQPMRPVAGWCTRLRTAPSNPVSNRRANISSALRPSGLWSSRSLSGDGSAAGAAEGSCSISMLAMFVSVQRLTGPERRSCRHPIDRPGVLARRSIAWLAGRSLRCCSCSSNVRSLRRPASRHRSWCCRP